MLEVHLLGRFEILLDGQPLDLPARPAQSLLAYLVLHPGIAHRREQLAGLLWPDSDEANARRYLSQALWRLRKSLGDTYFHTDKLSLTFTPQPEDRLDVHLLAQPDAQASDAWMDSLAVYQGRLLPGFYEDWAWEQAEHFQALFERQAQTLLDWLVTEHRWKDVLEWGEHWLRWGETPEPAYRALMQAHAGLGDQAGVAAVYRRCVTALERDIGVEPSPETTTLYEQIRSGSWQVPLAEPAPFPKASPKPIVIPSSPYRGLFAFREEDAPFFFGRELFTQHLVDAVQRQSLVAVVGPSGSGKSSVVFAGMLAQLQTEGKWLPAAFRPGNQPVYALAGALVPLLEPQMTETERLVETRKLAQALMDGALPLYDVVERILQKHPEKKHLSLVADQFEELYTLVPELEMRHKFLDILLKTAQVQQFRRAPAFTLVLTLRADFFGQALGYRPLADALQNADVKLGPMNRQELTRAITVPANRQGVDFETGLVERILDDVAEEPGNLPLLEFALTALWGELTTPQITHAAYETIGRVEGSLARYADEVFAGLSQSEQDAARQVFVQVVRPGEGTEDTRRLATKIELGTTHWDLVQRLADARLVVTGRDAANQETVEVVHEALIRGWGRLQAWMAEDRAFRVWQERLRAALRQWEASGQDEGALLRGVSLAEAENWLTERERDLSPKEKTFIQASLALQTRRQAEREQQQLEREQMLAARVRLQRRINLGLAAGLVLALLLTVFAGWQWNAARQAQLAAEAERDRADLQTQLALERFSTQLAARTLTYLDDQLDLALLLSIEAFRAADTVEARSSLATALSHNPQYLTRLWEDSEVQSIAFSPDRKFLASGNAVGDITLWNVANVNAPEFGQPVIQFPGHEGQVFNVTFSPNGRFLASAGEDAVIQLWKVEDLASISEPPQSVTLVGHTSRVLSLAFSPNGNILSSGGYDKNILLWDVDESSPTFGNTLGIRLGDPIDIIYSLAFSPDGQFLASGSCRERYPSGICSLGEFHLWDVITRLPLEEPFEAHQGYLAGLAFSSAGRFLASSGITGQDIRLWDVTPGSETFGQTVQTLINSQSTANALAFSPDGKVLASGNNDSTITLWTVSNGRPIGTPFTGHQEAVTSIAFSPDGQLIASGGEDNSIILWRMSDDHPLAQRLTSPEGELTQITASIRTSESLALGIQGGNIILWDLVKHNPIGQILAGHTDDTNTLLFSPDGKKLASGSVDGTVFLWDVLAGKPLAMFENQLNIRPSLCGFSLDPQTYRFSSDSRLFATASKTGQITVLDTETGQPIGSPLSGHQNTIWSLDISPDGKMLASGDASGEIMLWDISKGTETFGQKIGSSLIGQRDGVFALIFILDGKKLVSGSTADLTVWDVISGSPSFGQAIGEPILRCIGQFFEFSSSTFQTYFAYQENHTLQLWDMNTVQSYGQFEDFVIPSIFQYAYDPNRNVIALGSENGTVAFWDEATGELLFPPSKEHTGAVEWLLFSPDGRVLATTSQIGEILFWDTATGRPMGDPLDSYETNIFSLAFSPDGNTLATGDLNEEQIILWDVRANQQVGEPVTGQSNGLFFTNDGKILVSLSSTENSFFWDMDIESWLVRACRRANRNLTPAEWHQFFGDEPYRATCPNLPVVQE